MANGKKCPYCGKDIPSQAVICPYCTQKLNKIEKKSESSKPVTQSKSESKKKKSKTKLGNTYKEKIISLFAIIFGILALVVCIYLTYQNYTDVYNLVTRVNWVSILCMYAGVGFIVVKFFVEKSKKPLFFLCSMLAFFMSLLLSVCLTFVVYDLVLAIGLCSIFFVVLDFIFFFFSYRDIENRKKWMLIVALVCLACSFILIAFNLYYEFVGINDSGMSVTETDTMVIKSFVTDSVE